MVILLSAVIIHKSYCLKMKQSDPVWLFYTALDDEKYYSQTCLKQAAKG